MTRLLPSVRPLAAALVVAWCAAAFAQPAGSDALRDRYPPSSIDSPAKADEALAATSGAKLRVDKEFKDAARACIGDVLVNACLDGARAERRRRMADIDAIELEATRFKRRDRADRLETDRAKREAERKANAPADAEQRERNRKAYADKQAQAARTAAEKSARTPQPPKPWTRQTPKPAAVQQAEHAKNAADFAKKTRQAAEHRDEITRRVAQKTVERKRRADAREAKAAKDAKAASAAAKPVPNVTATAPTPLPNPAGPKP